ncbi:MAG: methyltransferase domain-containing protein [Firmicutes bacterium]|nr:methyltransferase domain-containing protein [Bacillota bacterium]
MNNTLRFSNGRSVFRCPICEDPLTCEKNSLICLNKHSFDISKHGYVNLAGGTKGSTEHYDKDSFKKRQQMLEAGYYSHISEELIKLVGELPNVVTVLDCGCGEGYYSRELDQQLSEKQLIAFDISRDSIQLAAKSDKGGVQWFVGDSTKLPIRSHSINCILDIFAPANYAEFRRAMSRTGYIIKVIPGKGHLKEFRQLAKDQLRKSDYDNQSVIDYFIKHFELIDRKLVSKTFEMPLEDREIFADMTPLMFNIDRSLIDLNQTTTLTVEGEILIGRPLDWNEKPSKTKKKRK